MNEILLMNDEDQLLVSGLPKTTMRISVILPTYNSVQYLDVCLQSIVNQHYEDVELIVMDAGSTDGTLETIKKYSDTISYWESCPDEGQFHAFNKGILRATGEWICLMGSDDYYGEDAFKTVVEAIQKFPEADLFYGDINTVDLQGRVISRHGARYASHKELATVRCFIPCQAVFFRRSLVAKVGLLSTRYKWSSDWEYWLRITERYRYRFIDSLLASWRINPNNTTYSIGRGYYRRYIETIKISWEYGRNLFAPLIIDNLFFGLFPYPLYRYDCLRRWGRAIRRFLR